MSRARKVDPALLEREYVYDSGTPPISITALADMHGMARSNIADMARRGKWYEKRREVRMTIGEKVLDAMTDQWAETHSAIRGRMLELSIKLLDQAEKDIEDGKVRITKVADITALVATVRVLLGDDAAQEAVKRGPTVIDMETIQIDPGKLEEMLPLLKRLTSGEDTNGTTAFEGHARSDAPADAAGVVED